MLVIPVGGCGEFGRNLTAYYCAETLVLVDCGIQMPDDLAPGVDHFVSDLSALVERFGPPHSVVLTHGHEDHVGAVYHLLRSLGTPVPIYGRPLALRLCQNRLRRNGVAMKLFDPRPIAPGEPLHLSSSREPDPEGLLVTPLAVPHSIPEACALLLSGPIRPSQLSQGKLPTVPPPKTRSVLHTGDFKVIADTVRFGPRPEPLPAIDLLVGDSTNALSSGNAGDEKIVEEALFDLLQTRRGRVAVTLFSSHIERIGHFARSCGQLGRRLCLLGRGLHDALDAAEAVGALRLPSSLLCSPDEAASLPPSEVALLCTGTQGETVAALGKLVAALAPGSPPPFGKLRLQPGDCVVLAARAIPGNERAISRLADRLVAHRVEVVSGPIYSVSGHGYRDELSWLLQTFLPRTLLPVHGGPRQLTAHADIARSLGIPALVQHNGDVIELGDEGQAQVVGQLPSGGLAVEGTTVGEVGPETLRMRRLVAQTGLVVIGLVHGQPQRLSVRTIGIADAGPALDSLCHKAARLGEELLATLSQTPSPVELQDVERSVGRAVRGLFRVARGVKPMVLCVLAENAQSDELVDVQPVIPSPQQMIDKD